VVTLVVAHYIAKLPIDTLEGEAKQYGTKNLVAT